MRRIGFTFLILLIYVTLTYIPIPLVDVARYQEALEESGTYFGIFDAFSGGALSRFSIVAMGISPYITASIIIQVFQMTGLVPQLKELSESGELGKQKINEYTRMIALVISFTQGLLLVVGLSPKSGNQFLPGVNGSILEYFYIGMVMTAGTAVVLWIADQITRKGIGNGSSIIIVTGIMMTIPTVYTSLYTQFYVAGGTTNIVTFFFLVGFNISIIVAVVFLQGSERRIPIQHSGQGGKQNSNIPVKLNTAGVMPVIFASTAMSVAMFIVQVSGASVYEGWGYVVNLMFNYTEPIGFALYIVLIFVFSFFYTFLMMAPDKVADNLQKRNAYIPGVRPGEDTEKFIAKVIYRITLVGATYLAVLAGLPLIMAEIFSLDSSVTIGGTSVLIVVGVAIETTKQLNVDATSTTYSGFLK